MLWSQENFLDMRSVRLIAFSAVSIVFVWTGKTIWKRSCGRNTFIPFSVKWKRKLLKTYPCGRGLNFVGSNFFNYCCKYTNSRATNTGRRILEWKRCRTENRSDHRRSWVTKILTGASFSSPKFLTQILLTCPRQSVWRVLRELRV